MLNNGKSGKGTWRLFCLLLGSLPFVVCGTVAMFWWPGRSRDFEPPPRFDVLEAASSNSTVDATMEARIGAFCGDCHPLPHPESFPREAWHSEVIKGYEFYAQSGRNDLDPPPLQFTAAYFQARAPEKLVLPEPQDAPTPLRAKFTIQKLTWQQQLAIAPAVAHLRWALVKPLPRPVLLACDMRDGSVLAIDVRASTNPVRLLARLENPCHVEPCDLDNDGRTDLVVADLGSFIPDDHDFGRVVWLHARNDAAEFEPTVLAAGMGRVADVRPIDVDGDSDLDLIVADFGLLRTGRIVLLRNVAAKGESPRFETQLVDDRPGAIHVPVHDWDGDGRSDFVALISQEYECVEMFLNQGGGKFHARRLWSGPDLTFGVSGMEPADLDQDGDLDILFTNGDSFDNMYVNAWHGVQWLENLGQMRFNYHRMADFTGAYRALPGDIDGDGDLDIIAVSSVPPWPKPAGISVDSLPAIICLEQVRPGTYARHTLAKGLPCHATFELADFDEDGDLDLAVGVHLLEMQQKSHPLAIWWNQAEAVTK